MDEKVRELHTVKIGLSDTTQMQCYDSMKCISEYSLEEFLTSKDFFFPFWWYYFKEVSFVEFGRGNVALISGRFIAVLISNTFQFHRQ